MILKFCVCRKRQETARRIIYALETQIIHAVRMETFNVQYVTTLHDHVAEHASRISLRYFRTFTLRCIRHRIQEMRLDIRTLLHC